MSRRGLAVACVLGALLFGAGGERSGAKEVEAPVGPRVATVAFGERNLDVWSMDPAGRARRALIDAGLDSAIVPYPLSLVDWAPDGESFAFTAVHEPSEDSSPDQLWVGIAAADGSDVRLLPGTRGGVGPIFDADGQRIAFVRERGRWGEGTDTVATSAARRYHSSTAWIVDADGGEPRRLTPWRNGLHQYVASFSPSGDALLLARRVRRRPPVLVYVPLDGRKRRVLARRATGGAFSPDGTKVALTVQTSPARRPGAGRTASDIFVLDLAAGGRLTRLSRTPRHLEIGPDWDPSGERIAFTRISTRTLIPLGDALVQINADGTCPRRILSLPAMVLTGATWRPGPGRGAGRIEC